MSTLIGITGGIGAGKSAVGTILESQGIPVIDSDHAVHDLLRNDRQVIQNVVARFGRTVVNTDGTISRKSLGDIVFTNHAALKDLEAIVHPAVRLSVENKVKQYADKPFVAFLVPLLFESGMQGMFDQTWSVTAPYKVCLERLKKRSGLTQEQVDQRVGAQLSQATKNSLADRVIDNSGDLSVTRTQIISLLLELSRVRQPG